MLLRFFRSTGAQLIIFIIAGGFVLWLHSFLKTPGTTFLFDDLKMPSYKLVSEIFPVHTLWATLLTFILVVVQGFLLVRMNTRFILINNRTYLPAIFFILLTSAIPGLQRLNPVIFSGFFLILALEQMFRSHRRENPVAYEYFVASFLISTGATFYPFLLFFIFIVWVGMANLRPFNWRELVFTILGFLLPWFFVFSYYYLVYDEPSRILNDFSALFEATYDFPQPTSRTFILGIFLAILIVVASAHMIRVYQGQKILPRKAFTIFLWLFINSLAVFLLFSQASAEMLFLMAIPLSYLFAHYFNFVKSMFWGNVLLIIFILLVVLIQVNSF